VDVGEVDYHRSGATALNGRGGKKESPREYRRAFRTTANQPVHLL
jgi:hypothetical protein